MEKALIEQAIAAGTIIYTLDMLGIFAGAVAASVLAKRLRFDAFGALLVSFVGSIGGGTLRDMMLDRHPLFWTQDLNYFYLICATSILTQVFYHYIERLDRAMRWFDALGLGAFTVIGIEAALQRGMAAPVVILMGVMSAIAGGVMRDMVCRQIPLVLQKEIYITASVAGSLYYLFVAEGFGSWARSISTIALIVAVRMLAVYRGWNLPDITLPQKKA